jgi:hypothetical protein
MRDSFGGKEVKVDTGVKFGGREKEPRRGITAGLTLSSSVEETGADAEFERGVRTGMEPNCISNTERAGWGEPEVLGEDIPAVFGIVFGFGLVKTLCRLKNSCLVSMPSQETDPRTCQPLSFAKRPCALWLSAI